MMNIVKKVPGWEIKNDLSKFLPLNQRMTIAKIKIWLMEKIVERE